MNPAIVVQTNIQKQDWDMFNKLKALVFFCLAACQVLDSEIVQVASFAEMEEELLALSPEGLAVFDVDQTLIIPTDKILRPCGQKLLYQMCMEQALTLQQFDLLSSRALEQLSFELLEERCVSCIHRLQERQVPTIALTAMRTGRWHDVVSMEQWRFHQLKAFDLDFSAALAGNPEVVLMNGGNGCSTVTFSNGIIASGDVPKGIALSAFLDVFSWHPQHVIFVDDRLDALESVEQAMAEKGISFKGYHYMAAFQLDETIDEDKAWLQILHFIQTGCWCLPE
jgi:hypothetical protein